MDEVEVEVVQSADFSDVPLPKYETENSAGMDVRAAIHEAVVIEPGKRAVIDTGLFIAIPEGYYVAVNSRSGLAAKQGVFVLNSPGILDVDYRGMVKVILQNNGDEPFKVNRGDRICQFILRKYDKIKWKKVDKLNETMRGTGGFGSTGKQ